MHSTSTMVTALSKRAVLFKFAQELVSSEAITEDVYRYSIDKLTGQSAAERVQHLLCNITSSVRYNAGLFNKLLVSLQKCGKCDLAHGLISDYYKGKHSCSCIIS